ncbi:MAG: phosphodiester glycosidase family protein, partial [Anaerolineales bacterium]|nr:phosphodiester glycosidase family protein [Anaerolineales bacterium]
RGSKGVDVLVELTRPATLMPYPHMVTGVVREIRITPGSTPIPFDHVVLSGWGNTDDQLVQFLTEGDAVGLSLEITHLDRDCKYPAPGEWTKTYASIAGNIIFLYEDEIQEFEQRGAWLLHPRTAICYNQDYLYFVVVDGRDNAYSIGMTVLELANFCQEELHATEGINLDGGGSSTMWVNGEVVNRPSDGHERTVANGMMMVIVEPMEKSSAFSPGTRVTAQYPTNLHLGPGTNFPALTSVDADTQGTVLHQWNRLNGVLAKSTHWWKVDFSGTIGWVDEAALSAIINTPLASLP